MNDPNKLILLSSAEFGRQPSDAGIRRIQGQTTGMHSSDKTFNTTVAGSTQKHTWTDVDTLSRVAVGLGEATVELSNEDERTAKIGVLLLVYGKKKIQHRSAA